VVAWVFCDVFVDTIRVKAGELWIRKRGKAVGAGPREVEELVRGWHRLMGGYHE
jgi:hypothetical protein